MVSRWSKDISCRSVGRCTFGARLDREIMDLVPGQSREGMAAEEQYAAPAVRLSTDLGRDFLYGIWGSRKWIRQASRRWTLW
jgi:hypothetical protein